MKSCVQLNWRKHKTPASDREKRRRRRRQKMNANRHNLLAPRIMASVHQIITVVRDDDDCVSCSLYCVPCVRTTRLFEHDEIHSYGQLLPFHYLIIWRTRPSAVVCLSIIWRDASIHTYIAYVVANTFVNSFFSHLNVHCPLRIVIRWRFPSVCVCACLCRCVCEWVDFSHEMGFRWHRSQNNICMTMVGPQKKIHICWLPLLLLRLNCCYIIEITLQNNLPYMWASMKCPVVHVCIISRSLRWHRCYRL